MRPAARLLPLIALLAACQTTVEGTPTGAAPAADPAQLEFRKVLLTEPDENRSAPPPSAAPDPAEVEKAKAARQKLDVADRAAVRAALDALDCAAPDPLRGNDDPALPLVTCDRAGTTVAKYVLDRAFLTGADVEQARAELDTRGTGWTIQLTFTGSGARTWADFTSANVGNQVAVVLDAEVVAAPEIQEAITGGNTVISGQFTREEAEKLAAQLGSR